LSRGCPTEILLNALPIALPIRDLPGFDLPFFQPAVSRGAGDPEPLQRLQFRVDSKAKSRFGAKELIQREGGLLLLRGVFLADVWRTVRPESGREAPERFLMAPLARIQSEQRRRLALGPSGIRLSDCLE